MVILSDLPIIRYCLGWIIFMMIDGLKSFEHAVKPSTGACALLTLAMVERFFHGRQWIL